MFSFSFLRCYFICSSLVRCKQQKKKKTENSCLYITSFLIANAVNDHHPTFISTQNRREYSLSISMYAYIFIYSAIICNEEEEAIEIKKELSEQMQEYNFLCKNQRIHNKGRTQDTKDKINKQTKSIEIRTKIKSITLNKSILFGQIERRK